MQSIGIDIGTSNTVAAVWTGREAMVIRDVLGERTVPSMISFEGPGRYIGVSARDRQDSNPENTLFGFNRLLGKAKPLEKDAKILPFKVEENGFDSCKIKVRYRKTEKRFSPEEIVAMMVSHVRKMASKGGYNINSAVIAVPVTFTNSQRQATKDAAQIAGLHVLGLINESSAAAIAYGYEKAWRKRTIMVINLGGGHLDVSVVTIQKNRFQVLFADGNENLGGQDFTERMVDDFIRQFEAQSRTRVKKGDEKANVAVLRMKCEKAKNDLSHMTENQKDEITRISVPNFSGGKELCGETTGRNFKRLNRELFNDVLKIVEKVKTDAEKIDEVVLVGGSTMMRQIRKKVKKLFKDDEIPVNTHLNAVEAIAQGAAIYAASFIGSLPEKDMVVEDIASRTLTVKYSASGLTEPALELTDKIPSTKFLQIGTNIPEVSVFEGKNEIKKIRGPPSILRVETDRDGIFEVTCPVKKHSRLVSKKLLRHTQIDTLVGQWEQNREDLNELQKLAFHVKRLIESSEDQSSDKRIKDAKKCSNILSWAKRNMKKDERKMNIRKRIKKREELTTLKTLYTSENVNAAWA